MYFISLDEIRPPYADRHNCMIYSLDQLIVRYSTGQEIPHVQFEALTAVTAKRCRLPGCNAVPFGENPPFRKNTSRPCARLKSTPKPSNEPVEAGDRLLVLVFCLAYSSTLKMDAKRSPEVAL
jgi:hypothetical protein